MSHIWTFSPKSKPLVQKCLSAAGPPNDSNIWCQTFGVKNPDLIKDADNIIILEDSPDMDVSHVSYTSERNQDEDIRISLEHVMDPDIDIISKFNKIQEISSINPNLLIDLARNLPSDTVNMLIHRVFSSEDISDQFLRDLFKYFLPVYIKKENSRLCIDLLIKTHQLYPHSFNILLKEIIEDLEIQSNILYDFVSTLNVDDQTKFLKIVMCLELSSEQFSHNLLNIYNAYKKCNKTAIIQENIFNLLKTHSLFCSTDKNYGKLFLSYLQEEKCLKRTIDTIDVLKILEIHKSAFKRPCLALISELK